MLSVTIINRKVMFDNSKESISVFILFFLQVCAFIFIYIYKHITYVYVILTFGK